MQPEHKRRGRADNIARARLLIKAHLGWVGGYPVSAERGRVAWRVAEPGRPNRVIPCDAVPVREGTVRWGPRIIDRAAIAGSTRAVKRLLGEYRGVLPSVVGEVDSWAAGIEAALAALKAVVHQGAELGNLLDANPEGKRGRRLAAARRALEPLLAALSWVDLASPDRLGRDLRLVERYARSFEQLTQLASRRGASEREARAGSRGSTHDENVNDGVATGLGLVELARGEEGRVAGLMALLGDPDLDGTPSSLGDYPDKIGRRLDGADISIGARPSASIARAALDLVGWIGAATPVVRRAALRAIAAAQVPRYLGRWRMIWTALEPAETLAARSREARERVPIEHAARCRRSLAWIPAAAPSPVNGTALRRAIERLSAPDARPLLALVAGSPDDDDLPVRLELMVGLSAELEHLDRPQVAGLVALLRAYLARSPDPLVAWRALAPVLVAPRFRLATSLGDLLPPARWRQLGEAIAGVVAGGREELEVESLLRLAVLLAATGSVAAAVRHLPSLDARAVSPWNNGVRVALALGEDPAGFDELVARIARDGGELAVGVERVLGAAGPGAARLVRALIDDGETGRLRDAAGWIELARAIRGCQLPPLEVPAPSGRTPDWAARYPLALRPALALADSAGAREAAQRKLEGLFPDPDRLRREIAAIDQRLPGGPAHLAQRRANLVVRLEAPRAPAPVRLARLSAEIERGARASVFDRWASAVERCALEALPRALGLASGPGWLESREHRAVLIGAVGLKGESRRLARLLFATRAGSPPWDLRSEPANRTFIARLARRRIASPPWLDGIGSVRFEDPSGALHLALEEDPLEVLRMGEHFGTCLAPGGENFYSTWVNAVDINKRVLYGRDAGGAVVGRCLLALTDTGTILTFHPYCHRGEFAAMVRGFTAELASRMGTRVVAHGAVSPLLASRWYDDGPHDLTGRHDFLAEDSSFRNRLASIPPGELVGQLQQHLGSLDGASLALIVALSELDDRAELIGPLLPLLDGAAEVPLETRLRAIQLAESAGLSDQLGPRTARHLEAGLEGRIADGRVGLEPIDRLASLDPVRLMALVRRARRRLRPSERGERPLLSYAAARAHLALVRPRRAADEYARALTATSDENLRAVCRTALGELSRAAR